MNPFDTLKTALWSLGSSKLRSSLTLLGIIIGIAAVMVLMTIGTSIQKSITERIQSQGANLLFIQYQAPRSLNTSDESSQSSTLTISDASALVNSIFAPSIKSAAPEISIVRSAVYKGASLNARIVGVTPEYESVRNAVVAHGDFFSLGHIESNASVAIISASVSESLFDKLIPIGELVKLGGRTFEVIGVLEDNNVGFGQDNRVLVPITTAHHRLAPKRYFQGEIVAQSITVQASSQDSMSDAEQEIATILRLRHRITGDDDFVISSQAGLIETLNETTNSLVIFLGSVAGISLLVGGIGVMNIMLVSVTERTREIGIRKAIGAKRRDIMSQFLAEATLLTLSGGCAGLLIGLAFTKLLDGVPMGGPRPLDTEFDLTVAVLALSVSGLIGLVSGIYPAVRAARMHPIEALRYE